MHQKPSRMAPMLLHSSACCCSSLCSKIEHGTWHIAAQLDYVVVSVLVCMLAHTLKVAGWQHHVHMAARLTWLCCSACANTCAHVVCHACVCPALTHQTGGEESIMGCIHALCRRDRSLPADCKMATRERNRTRDRSKSSDISGEASLAATAAAAQARPASTGPHRLASGHLHAAPPASTAAAPPAPTRTSSPPLRLNPADLLVAAAAAVNRADALQLAEASESDMSPHAWHAAPQPFELAKRRKEKEAERRAKRDRQGQAAAKADEEQVPQGREEAHGAGDAAKQDEAPAVSGPDTKRARRKVCCIAACMLSCL